jgi:hypothetical protein
MILGLAYAIFVALIALPLAGLAAGFAVVLLGPPWRRR